MQTHNKYFALRKLTLLVQGALIAMIASPLVTLAADDEASSLTKPTSSIELGVQSMPRDSAKFGEYNGVDESGAYLIGNFNIRGGNAYKAYEGGDGVNRWEAYGVDLGTTSREIGGSVSNQGQWSLGLKFDELRHNISDTYQTPLVGKMGGNSFTMPAAFGVINTAYVQDLALPALDQVGAQYLTPTQQGLFHTVEVHTTRENSSLNAGYTFNQQWSTNFDYNHLNQTGAKLMMVSTDVDSTAAPSGKVWGFEKMMMLMNPTNYTTDTFNLALNWKGDNSFLTAGYFGSIFRDANNSLTFPNVFVTGATTGSPNPGTTGATFPINTMSTMPDNDFHQFNLTGGYTFTPTTKVAGGFSYARNTQNDAYPFAMLKASSDHGLTGSTASLVGGGVPPQSSLDGLVKTLHADFKLTNEATKNLTLSAGMKFNERDNRTASNTYNFIDLGGKNRTAVNTPMSNRKTQVELASDYRINPDNRVRLAYEYEKIERWCNNALANDAQGVAPAGYTYTTHSCVQVPESNENKLAASYKVNVNEAVNFNAGYSFAKRNARVNDTFYNPMQALAEGFENYGYRAFFDASRNEQQIKLGANIQPTEKLSFGASGRYLIDHYEDSPLGVQQGSSLTGNFDATYNYSDKSAVSAFVSLQKRQRDLLSGGVTRTPITANTSLWTNQLYDKDTTLGLSAYQKGFLANKLDFAEALTYSLGNTVYKTQVPYLSTCSATTALTCGSTPNIVNSMLSIGLTGNYHVDKASKVSLAYMYQRLNSTDYYYNTYQTGYTATGVLATNEQAPSYSVSVVTATYTYDF